MASLLSGIWSVPSPLPLPHGVALSSERMKLATGRNGGCTRGLTISPIPAYSFKLAATNIQGAEAHRAERASELYPVCCCPSGWSATTQTTKMARVSLQLHHKSWSLVRQRGWLPLHQHFYLPSSTGSERLECFCAATTLALALSTKSVEKQLVCSGEATLSRSGIRHRACPGLGLVVNLGNSSFQSLSDAVMVKQGWGVMWCCLCRLWIES
jgi:hypothetical protein